MGAGFSSFERTWGKLISLFYQLAQNISHRVRKNPNQKGLDFYSRIIDTLLEYGIIPFITLNHWDIPQGLEDKGGWTNRMMSDMFVKYSYYVSKNFGDRVKHWITHNEPWCISHIGYITGHKPPGIKNNWVKSLFCSPSSTTFSWNGNP